MELTTNCKSPRDAYIWIEQYNKLEANEKIQIKNKILKNQYHAFLKHIINISKYQLINKLNEILNIFSKEELHIFFNKFGLKLSNQIFWLNTQSSLNNLFINYLKFCNNETQILTKYEENKKILAFFYELSNFTLNNNSDIKMIIKFLKLLSSEIRVSLLLYNFDFPSNSLYKQNLLTALISLHRNSELDKIFSEPDFLSNNQKQKLFSHIDENNNSLIHAAAQYNNLKGLVFILSSIKSNFIKGMIITKKLSYLNSNKVFLNNGLSPIHIAIINNNLNILKYLFSGFTARAKYKLITNHKTEEFSLNYSEHTPYELAMLNNDDDIMHFLSTSIPFFYKNNFKFLIFKNLVNCIDDIIKIPFSKVIFYLYNTGMIYQNKSNLLDYNKDFISYYENEAEKLNQVICNLIDEITKNNKIIDTINILIQETIKFRENEDKSPLIILNFKNFLRENLHFITKDETKIKELIDEIVSDLEKDPINYLNNISLNFSHCIKSHKKQNILLTIIQGSPNQSILQNKLSLLNKIKNSLFEKYQLMLNSAEANNNLSLEISKPKAIKRKDPIMFFIDFNNKNSPNLTACRSSESMENLSGLCSDSNLDNELCKYKMGQIIEPFTVLYKNNYNKICVLLKNLELKLHSLLNDTRLTEEKHKRSFKELSAKHNLYVYKN